MPWLAPLLHELPELPVNFTSAAWLIVRRGVAGTTAQAGSAEMCREIVWQTGSGTNCTFMNHLKNHFSL
jgi:hypothetical protein